MMDDLKFENQILQAEVAALISELREAKENENSRRTENGALLEQQKEMQAAKDQVKVLHEENKRISLELAQSKNKHVEIDSLKQRIIELEWNLKSYRESDHQKEIASMTKLMLKQDDIIRELGKDIRAAEFDRTKLKEEIKLLNYRLSSPYIQKRKAEGKIISFMIGGCVTGGVIIISYILRINL
jgi:chromosome segregation ATPase